MKSKVQTDQEIISSADDANNEISQVLTRHSDSVHPLDCLCLLCKNLRHETFDSGTEFDEKAKLDWQRP